MNFIEKVCGPKPYCDLAARLDGARCLLVGGANWADVKSDPLRVDWDCVIQLNDHIRRRPYQRCDWLITRTSNLNAAIVKKIRCIPPQIISAPVNRRTMAEEYYALTQENSGIFIPFMEGGFVKENPYHHSLEWCNALHNQLATNPLMGILAIKLILRFPIKSLKLTGFDFYTQWDGKHIIKRDSHYIPSQENWLYDQWNNDFRLQFDEALHSYYKIDGHHRRGITQTFREA